MAISVVRRHERRFFVLAEILDQNRTDRGSRGLAVEVLPEAVTHAILSGCVIRAGYAGQIDDLFALRELVHRHRDRARSRADHYDHFVLGNEARLLLNRRIRLGLGVCHDILHFLAEHALLGLGRYLLDQLITFVDVLDGELHALELVFARFGVSAGARHGDAHRYRVAGCSVRPGPDRRMVRRQCPLYEVEW